MHEILAAQVKPDSPMVISGCVGPRGDGYASHATMNSEQAARYHTPQLRAYREAGADLVSAFTMTYAEEELGIANAAAALDIPVVISFTLETDGRLPSGQALGEAIEWVDTRSTQPPAY